MCVYVCLYTFIWSVGIESKRAKMTFDNKSFGQCFVLAIKNVSGDLANNKNPNAAQNVISAWHEKFDQHWSWLSVKLVSLAGFYYVDPKMEKAITFLVCSLRSLVSASLF